MLEKNGWYAGEEWMVCWRRMDGGERDGGERDWGEIKAQYEKIGLVRKDVKKLRQKREQQKKRKTILANK